MYVCVCVCVYIFADNNKYYKQVRGALMGSPLLPAIASIFMNHFEQKSLDSFHLEPTYWLRYVDNVFVIWPHKKEELENFHRHVNSIHPSITFTKEIEQNNVLLFQDVLITKTKTTGFHHTVYRKPTHTNRYLYATSHHYPPELNRILKTLAHR